MGASNLNETAKSALEKSPDPRVEQEITSMLMANGTTGGLAVILGAALMAPVLAQESYRHLYLPWLAYMAISALVRVLAVHRYNARPENVVHWPKWRWIYGVLSCSIGFGWATAPFLFLSTLPPNGIMYLLVVLIGVAAAAIPLLSPDRRIYLAYVLPIIASQVVLLSNSDDMVSISLAAVLVVFLGLLWTSVSRVNQALRSALILQFANEDLIHSLQAENQAKEEIQKRLEAHTDGLEAKVATRTRALEYARNAAVAANGAKNDFLATMSHEIRTPMNGIIGTTELLLRTELEGPQLDYVETCRASASSLLSLINELLDFSKIEAGRLDIERIPTRLADLCSELAQLFASEIDRKGLELKIEVHSNVPQWLELDFKRVRQVLINLLGNAMKFTAEGSISLRIRQQSNHILFFEIEDTGPGMAEDLLAHVFSPFVQADSSTTREHEGTGLGLAISSQLVKLMGGQIGVESSVGRGARFWFSLPAYEVEQPKRELVSPLNQESKFLNLHILVVEDNPVNQIVCEAMLRELGCSCDIVQHGEEAVSYWSAAKYDAILMDLSMPVVDGYEATIRIREQEKALQNNREIPIIALTAHALEQDRINCLKTGMNGFVTKPMTIKDLESALLDVIPE